VDSQVLGPFETEEFICNIKSLEMSKRRNDLVHEFLKKTKLSQVEDGKPKGSYLTAEGDAERRSILLRWIL
jgi:hypothetical protein